MITGIKLWLKGARAPFLVASAVPVVFAGGLATLDSYRFDWLSFFAVLLGVVLIHAAANMTNEYYDFFNKTDVVNKNRTMFSGGSGLLVDGTLSPGYYRTSFIILYLTAFILGVFLFIRAGENRWILLLLASAGFLLTYFYSCPPVNFAHRGLGELVVGICFAPLPVLGTYMVLTGRIEFGPVFASLPIMFLIIAVLYINQFPDTEADSYADKRNLVIRLGRRRAAIGYYALMAATYVAVVTLVATGYLPPYSLAALLTIPLALKASIILHDNYEDPRSVFPAMGMTILNHHITGLLLTGGLIVEKIAR